MDKNKTNRGAKLLLAVALANLVFLFSELAFNVLGVMLS